MKVIHNGKMMLILNNTAHYEYGKKFSFAMFDMKLWLKEENILHKSLRMRFRMNEFE